jgi:acetyl esterase/lipase
MPALRIYDPEIEAVASKFPWLDISDVAAARATLKGLIADMAAHGMVRPVDDRIDEIERLIPGPGGAPDVRIRIYMPKDRTEPGPGFVNFHGGGFVLGDLESEHPRCLVMAAEAGAVSVGVDYRLAPENPFPAGLEDCYAALQWVVEHAAELKINPAQIAIGGCSAGGNLAAAVALLARDRGGPHVAMQMLFYPVIDDRCTTASMQNGEGLYIWDSRNCRDMWNQYIGPDRSAVSPYAAPGRADDLSGLPPAYVMTCEHDPLRDEGLSYATRLLHAGVPVELHNYAGTVHGFDFMMQSGISSRAVREAVEAFRQVMAS